MATKNAEMLKNDGYHATDLIEKLRDDINSDAEFKFMVKFVEESCFKDDERSCDWIQMLWTAYCLHQNLDVDTSDYDQALYMLWSYIMKNEDRRPSWNIFDSFDNFMCKYLV